ncbi:hypothetical protein ASF70_15625 [Rhizobium sp. Leaf321]|nr:hypothetical protein [Rhizobium sp. Leaf321]KQQ72901.1 hypothetical protein ASF70_15625 [Rhizobium sp. Leaf321]
MHRDDLDDEERFLIVTKYGPSLVIFGCLFALGVPMAVSIAVALFFALLGYFALFKHLRATIAALVVVATIAWFVAPSDLKQLIRTPYGEAHHQAELTPKDLS